MTGTKGGGSPKSGEIDVFESKGYDPKFIQANIHTAPTQEKDEKKKKKTQEKYSDQYQQNSLIMEIRKRLSTHTES